MKICFVSTMLLMLSAAVPADLQKAATIAVPATVEVEFQPASKKPTENELSRSETPTDRVEQTPGGVVSRMRLGKGSGFGALAGGIGGGFGGFRISRRLELLSGTVVSADGLIVTRHPSGSVSGEPSVRLPDGTKLAAKILVRDERSSLCLLKVDAADLSWLEISKDEPAIGQEVAAVVTVHGFRNSFVTGHVSARDQVVKSDTSLPPVLQTDLAAGTGSDGGPLVNRDGQLIGIVATMLRGGRDRSGISFAVPAVHVAALLEAERQDETAEVKRGFLGVSLKDGPEGERVFVSEVHSGSAADRAGIRDGDRFVSVNEAPVRSAAEVRRRIGMVAAGETVTLEMQGADSDKRQFAVQLDPRGERVVPGAPGVRVELKTNPRILILGRDDEPAEATHRIVLDGLVIDAQQAEKRDGPSAIRVERTRLEEKIDELNQQILQLREQITQLRATVVPGQDTESRDD